MFNNKQTTSLNISVSELFAKQIYQYQLFVCFKSINLLLDLGTYTNQLGEQLLAHQFSTRNPHTTKEKKITRQHNMSQQVSSQIWLKRKKDTIPQRASNARRRLCCDTSCQDTTPFHKSEKETSFQMFSTPHVNVLHVPKQTSSNRRVQENKEISLFLGATLLNLSDASVTNREAGAFIGERRAEMLRDLSLVQFKVTVTWFLSILHTASGVNVIHTWKTSVVVMNANAASRGLDFLFSSCREANSRTWKIRRAIISRRQE